MTETVPRDWNARRSILNHGWLAKTYPAMLGAWRSVLSGDVRDKAFAEQFLSHGFADWERMRGDLIALVRDFPQEMSPRVLFAKPPLDKLEEPARLWLPELVHQMWWTRCSIEALLVDANSLLAAADASYIQLRHKIDSMSSDRNIEELIPELHSFVAFHALCGELSESISKFPHEIRVT